MTKTLDEAGLDLIFRAARSYNGYTDVPVSDADLQAIYELARMGPTAANTQPMRVAWVKSQAAKDKLAAIVSPNNVAKVLSAPVIAIVGMDHGFAELMPKIFPHNPGLKTVFESNAAMSEVSAFRNSTLQGAYLIIAARALGFDTGPMSGFDNAKVDEAFFAGTQIKSNFICTLGVGDPATIFERLPRLDFGEANSIV